jgi:ABC-2 type transport system ATP-binding protein
MSTDTINTLATEQGHFVPAVEAESLVKIFGDNRAVDNINLLVPVGMVYGVLGPNGAGKTTMINILATLLRPDSGTAKIFGHDVLKEANTVRQLMRVTGQYASLDEALTGYENLVIFSRLLGLSPAQARKRTNDLLEEFELTDAARRPVSKFSGGMRRRLDLAASIISQTPLLFLDEPTTGLDPHNRARMWTLVRRLVMQGTTVILTTQYLDEADQLADRIAVIDHGRVVAEGPTNELKASIGTTSLHLQLTEQADADVAMSTIGRVLGTKGTLIDSKHISAPMANPDLIADLLVAFRDAGIRLAELSVQKPTLDEVFLILTGHSTTEEPTPLAKLTDRSS